MKPSSRISNILLSLCEAVIGVLLLVNPVGFTTGIIIFLGAVLIILGLISVIQYFRTSPEIAAVKQGLTRGCLEILAGLFFILKHGWFIATFPILTILYGIGTLGRHHVFDVRKTVFKNVVGIGRGLACDELVERGTERVDVGGG